MPSDVSQDEPIASGSRSRRSSTSSSSSSSSSASLFVDPPAELIGEYEHLLRQRFADLDSTGLLPTQPTIDDALEGDHDDDESGRPMTKAEKQNAKKKRRKERERLAKQQAERGGGLGEGSGVKSTPALDRVAFRLFSSCPVRPVSIMRPTEEYPLPPNPQHQPYTPDECGQLHARAVAAAVDWPDLGPPSVNSYDTRWARTDRPTPTKRMRTSTSTSTGSLPNMFIGTSATATRAIEHELEPAKPTSTSKRTRRGKRSIPLGQKQKSRPEPAYWTPGPGRHVGGKSMMTVWGYGLGMASV